MFFLKKEIKQTQPNKGRVGKYINKLIYIYIFWYEIEDDLSTISKAIWKGIKKEEEEEEVRAWCKTNNLKVDNYDNPTSQLLSGWH